jgi:hypothetical protein
MQTDPNIETIIRLWPMIERSDAAGYLEKTENIVRQRHIVETIITRLCRYEGKYLVSAGALADMTKEYRRQRTEFLALPSTMAIKERLDSGSLDVTHIEAEYFANDPKWIIMQERLAKTVQRYVEQKGGTQEIEVRVEAFDTLELNALKLAITTPLLIYNDGPTIPHVLQLAENIATVARIGDEMVDAYIEDLLAAFAKKAPKVELVAHSITAAMFEEHVAFGNALAAIDPAIHMRISHPDTIGFLDVEGDRYRVLRHVVESLDAAQTNGQDAKFLLGIAATQPLQKRAGILRRLVSDDTLHTLISAAKKAQLRPAQLASLVLSADDLTIAAVCRVAQHQRYAALKELALHPELLTGEQSEELISIAREYSSGGIILREYHESLGRGEWQRARILLDIGKARPRDQELKFLRQKLASSPHDLLEEIVGERTPEQRVESLRRYRPGKERPQHRTSRPVREHWYSPIITQLKHAGADEKQLQTFEETCGRLPTDCSDALIQTLEQEPQTIDVVCTDLLKYGRLQSYRVLTLHTDLFSQYLSRIATEKTSEWLKDALYARNPLAALRELLVAKKDRTSPGTLLQTAPSVAERQPRYGRVLVYGGRFREEQITDLRTKVPVPVIVHDETMLNRARGMSMGPGDLVLFYTRHANHTIAHPLVAACKDSGATLRSTDTKNVDRLAQRIGELLYEKK